MTEHDPKAQDHVEDLDVPDRDADDVNGGTATWYLKNTNSPGAPSTTQAWPLKYTGVSRGDGA